MVYSAFPIYMYVRSIAQVESPSYEYTGTAMDKAVIFFCCCSLLRPPSFGTVIGIPGRPTNSNIGAD